MPQVSNAYAEKIFSEHPLALWPLDEKLDYVSLISDDQRDVLDESEWAISGGEVEETSFVGPIFHSPTRKLLGDEPSGETGSILLIGPDIVNAEDLDQELGTFAIAAYFYSETSFVESVEIGYQLGSAIPVLKKSKFGLVQSWRHISKTFEIPDSSDQIKPVIKINYLGSETPEQDYGFFVNAITAGQWAEQFNLLSLGIEPVEVPSDIPVPAGTLGVPIDAYGSNLSGYYLASSTSIAAKNFGVPMVFGSNSVTTMRSNDELPSLIVPGFGFLNKLGQFRNLTLEFWLRVNSAKDSPEPIVKSLGSSDGLYVDGPFLVFKIDQNSHSHFVGEWGRPMLINISVTNTLVKVLLNSEEVLSIPISSESLSLANPTNSQGQSQDWLGFYATENTGPVQVDCVAIYPYQVSEILAKRRMVYAQAVDLSENTDSSYISSYINIDYPFARYANNYNYPDIGRWQNGLINNLEVNANTMSLPEYSPALAKFSSGKTKAQWINDLSEIQSQGTEPWMQMRPNSSWDEVSGYLLFESLGNVLKQPLVGFYGIFEKAAGQGGPLIQIKDRNSQNYFEISINENTVSYDFFYNGTLRTVLSKENIVNDQKFICGISIDKFAKYFGEGLSAFFGKRKDLEVYVGGKSDLTNTFTGKIFSFHLDNRENISKVSSFVDVSGALVENGTTFFDDSLDLASTAALNSSYTLRLAEDRLTTGQYELSVAASASWQDYIPLTVLSKNVKNASNDNYYSLDFVQVNFDYPRTETVSEGFYDTSSEVLRAYVTFQPLTLGAHRSRQSYRYTVRPPSNGVIQPGSYVVDNQGSRPILDSFVNTRYEIVNGMIVYPPANIAKDKIAMTVHFEVSVPSVSRYPVKIKSLELASLALNDITENPVGTHSGVSIFPYTKLNIYFDYKRRNPFEIYKGSTPYLYLTKNSGIKLRGDQEIGLSRGISFPINQGRASSYDIGAMQFSFRYDEDRFPATAVELFEIESANDYIKFYLVAEDEAGQRGRVYGINTETGTIQPGLVFYLNGLIQRDAVINLKEWSIMGLQFIEGLSFGNFSGAFRLTGPILLNNFYHYQYSSFEEVEAFRLRTWLSILNTEEGTAIWEDYAELTWFDVLFALITEKPLIDPARLYRVYTGTNRFVVGDDKALSLTNHEYRFYSSILWDTRTTDAV
jgi:hypothetical protein